MEIISITGKVPTKRVIVQNVQGVNDDDLLAFAVEQSGETLVPFRSITGFRISRGDTDTAMVTLHTD